MRKDLSGIKKGLGAREQMGYGTELKASSNFERARASGCTSATSDKEGLSNLSRSIFGSTSESENLLKNQVSHLEENGSSELKMADSP